QRSGARFLFSAHSLSRDKEWVAARRNAKLLQQVRSLDEELDRRAALAMTASSSVTVFVIARGEAPTQSRCFSRIALCFIRTTSQRSDKPAILINRWGVQPGRKSHPCGSFPAPDAPVPRSLKARVSSRPLPPPAPRCALSSACFPRSV